MQSNFQVFPFGNQEFSVNRDYKAILESLKLQIPKEDTWLLFDYGKWVLVNEKSRLENIRQLRAISIKQLQEMVEKSKEYDLLKQENIEMKEEQKKKPYQKYDEKTFQFSLVQETINKNQYLEEIGKLKEEIKKLKESEKQIEDKFNKQQLILSDTKEQGDFDSDRVNELTSQVEFLSSEINCKTSKINELITFKEQIVEFSRSNQNLMNQNQHFQQLSQQESINTIENNNQENYEQIQQFLYQFQNQSQELQKCQELLKNEQLNNKELLEKIKQLQNKEQLDSQELQNCQEQLKNEQLKNEQLNNKELLEKIKQLQNKEQLDSQELQNCQEQLRKEQLNNKELLEKMKQLQNKEQLYIQELQNCQEYLRKEQLNNKELLEKMKQFQNKEQLDSQELQNCQVYMNKEQLNNKELLEKMKQNEKNQQQLSEINKLMETSFYEPEQEKLNVNYHLNQFLKDDNKNNQEKFLEHLLNMCSDLIQQLRKERKLTLCDQVTTSIKPLDIFYIFFKEYNNPQNKVPSLNHFRRILLEKKRIENINEDKMIQQQFLIKVMINGESVWFCRKSYKFNLSEQEAQDIIFNYLIAYEYMKLFAQDLLKDTNNNNRQQSLQIIVPKLLLVRDSEDSFSVFQQYFENTIPQSYKYPQAQNPFDQYINSFCFYFYFSMNKNAVIDKFKFETYVQNQSQNNEIIFKSAVINTNFTQIFSVLDKGINQQFKEKYYEELPQGVTGGFWSKSLENYGKENWNSQVE